jgi:hypothetical protein
MKNEINKIKNSCNINLYNMLKELKSNYNIIKSNDLNFKKFKILLEYYLNKKTVNNLLEYLEIYKDYEDYNNTILFEDIYNDVRIVLEDIFIKIKIKFLSNIDDFNKMEEIEKVINIYHNEKRYYEILNNMGYSDKMYYIANKEIKKILKLDE